MGEGKSGGKIRPRKNNKAAWRPRSPPLSAGEGNPFLGKRKVSLGEQKRGETTKKDVTLEKEKDYGGPRMKSRQKRTGSTAWCRKHGVGRAR